MRQLQEASDGASFAGLSAGILWMPFGPDGILWTTVRIGSLVVTARAASKSLMYSSQVSGPAHSWLHRTHRTLSQPASALTRTEGFRPGRHPCSAGSRRDCCLGWRGPDPSQVPSTLLPPGSRAGGG